ncbi:MAG: cytochrome c biogenesis protein CcdA, partial [Mesorhizobium sp.]
IGILFGLFLTGLLRPSCMMREARFHSDMPTGRAASAYVLGLAFAFGWTPCIGPILGAILTVGAASATV